MSDNFACFCRMVTEGLQLHRAGDHESALQLAKQAEGLVSGFDPPLSPEAAESFKLLGVILFESGFARSSLTYYQRSLDIAQRLAPPDPELFASLYNNLGQCHETLGNLVEAQAALERAVELHRNLNPQGTLLAFALDNLGGVLCQRGELDRAETLHLEALDLLQGERGPHDPEVATVFGRLGHLYRLRSDHRRAEACLLRALDSHDRRYGLSGSTLLDLASLAELYLTAGDDVRADRCLNLLLRGEQQKPGLTQRFLAEMLLRLARTCFSRFRLDLCERLGVRAVELLEAVEGPGAPETLEAVYLLANVRRALGSSDDAAQGYLAAISGYQQLEMAQEALAVQADLAKLYLDRGDFPLAEELFVEALQNVRQSGKKNPKALGSLLGNLALVYYETGKYQAADADFIEALAELPEGDMERAWVLHNRAMLKYHLGDYQSARDLYGASKRLWAEFLDEEHPYLATAAHNLALVEWAEGEVDAALASFRESEKLRSRAMVRILAVGDELQRAAYARERLDDLYQAVSFCLSVQGGRCAPLAEFAAEMLLRYKGRVLDAVAHTFVQLHKSVRPEERAVVQRLQAVRREQSELVAPFLLARRKSGETGRLAGLRAEEKRLEAELSYLGALHDPDLAEVSLPAIRDAIPADALLIELLRFPTFDPVRSGEHAVWKEERYAALVVGRGDTRWFDLGPASVVDEECERLCKLLRRCNSEQGELDDSAETMYQLLVAPLEGAISGARQLLVVPDGTLVLMPFGVLRAPGGRGLAESFLVSYLTSGRDLRPVSPGDEGGASAVIFAAADFDAEREPGMDDAVPGGRFGRRDRFEPLPGTLEEGETIRDLVGEARLLTGKEATVSALRELRMPRLLHVATHGIFAPMEEEGPCARIDLMPLATKVLFVEQAREQLTVNPMLFSGLALSGANSGRAGIITAQEIAGLDLRGTELVVLSACQTGLGTVKPHAEFTGLRRALAIAGARTQVTSLWKVNDSASRALMEHYYTLLLEGYGRAEALQTAQSLVAGDRTQPEWRHPFYWAAFVSAGAWGPITGMAPAGAQKEEKR